MTEASRVQKLLIEQNAEIVRLKNRVEKLEAALIDILKVPRSEASWGIALVIARKALDDAP